MAPSLLLFLSSLLRCRGRAAALQMSPQPRPEPQEGCPAPGGPTTRSLQGRAAQADGNEGAVWVAGKRPKTTEAAPRPPVLGSAGLINRAPHRNVLPVCAAKRFPGSL